MAEPFESRSEKSAGLISKVAGRVTRAAALHELEGLLADAEGIRDVTMERVRELGERHGVDLTVQLRTLRRNLYRRFFEHCLLDYALSDSEVEDLDHLRELLHLSDGDLGHVQDQVAREVYGAAVEEVLDDHRLDDAEVAFLKKLRKDLDLADYHANRIVEEGQRRSQQRLMSRAAVRPSFLAPTGFDFELRGVSTSGLDGAIQAAIDEASQGMPRLAWAELTELKVQIESGRVVSWAVKLRAGIEPEERGDQTA